MFSDSYFPYANIPFIFVLFSAILFLAIEQYIFFFFAHEGNLDLNQKRTTQTPVWNPPLLEPRWLDGPTSFTEIDEEGQRKTREEEKAV